MKQQLKLYILLAMIAVACASTRAWAQVNYDESKVKPYTLEDPLRFVNGKKVKITTMMVHLQFHIQELEKY